MQEMWIQSLGREYPLVKEMAIHSNILTWKSRGQRSLAGYSSWGCKQLDTTMCARMWMSRLPDISLVKSVYLGSAENCSLESVAHEQTGKENAFIEGTESWESQSKQSMAFHWLSPCQEKEGSFLFVLDSCYPWGAWELPLLVSWLYLTEASVC